jgi:hypothetical protein
VTRTPEPALSIPANLGLPVSSNRSSQSGHAAAIAGSVLPLRRAEGLIATLPGVLSVRIVPGETGAIEEVHVLTTDAVPPKTTVRNIESALMAELGMRVNHRKISIATTLEAASTSAQPAARETSPPPGVSREGGREVASGPLTSITGGGGGGQEAVGAPVVAPVRGEARGSRGGPAVSEGRRLLIFDDVEVRRSRSKGVLCRVTLHRDGIQYAGEAEGEETERSRVELAARAAMLAIVQAVSASTGTERTLSLEGAKRFEAFDREFIFVSVTARLGRELVVLTGSCEVRESAETSAVLSVLDATNRWVHLER